MDDLIDERIPDKPEPDPERVRSRSASLRREQRKIDDVDHEAEAEELLRESEARTDADPATQDLKDDRVERRTSDEATPPPQTG